MGSERFSDASNLPSAQDQHDSIDFTDNALSSLSNLPLLKRLRSLHLANNRIASISPLIHHSAPNLHTLILTNNQLTELGDLEPLGGLKYLKFLSLLGNGVREKKWYREWVIFKCKGLRVLDYTRIRDKVCNLMIEHVRTRSFHHILPSFSPLRRNELKPSLFSSHRIHYRQHWRRH